MEHPTISIIMSVYNGEKHLSQAIESVLTQTHKDFEFIIINDGSIDESLNIIEKYRNLDNRIILIDRTNKGLPYSLNEGIKLSKGKYIARMDADDICLSTRLNEQYLFMENNLDTGICGTWIETFGKHQESKVIKYAQDNKELQIGLLFSNPFAHPTVMIRKEILAKYNLKYNIKYTNSQDYELWSRISQYTKMSNIQKVLLEYRVSNSSITQTTKLKNELKYKLSTGAYTNILNNLNIKNNSEENRLHFNIGQDYRIKENTIDFISLKQYFKKIKVSNNKVKFYDDFLLDSLLSIKFFFITYIQLKKLNPSIIFAFNSKFFWLGMYRVIKKKI